MSLALATGQNIAGVAGTASAITYTLFGDEISGTPATDAFKVLGQGVLGTSAATMYVAGAGIQSLVKTILLANTTGSAVAVTLFVNGMTAANQITSFIIPGNGEATFTDDGWCCYDSTGARQTSGATGPQGLQGPTGSTGSQGPQGNPGVLTTVNTTAPLTGGGSASSLTLGVAANGIDATLLADMAAATVRGRVLGGATGDPQDLTGVQVADIIAGLTSTAYGRAQLGVANATADTAQLDLATAVLKGLLGPSDKKLIDNLHYDAVADFAWVGNDSTDNLTPFNTMKAALPVGAAVFFAAGTYRVSNELTIDVDKRLNFRGVGRYTSIIKTTHATANIFNVSVPAWYITFSDLGFQSTVTKTAGAAIAITAGNNVGINTYRLWITGVFKGIWASGSQSANLSVWSDLDISGIPNGGRGLHIDGNTINVMIHNATINAGAATTSACCEINQSGAVQVTGCDWIQGTNVLLINSTGGAGPQACYFTNCFFDQPQGSVIKVIGTNTANRIKFIQCGIAPTGNNHAVEINGTGTGAVGTATALPAGFSFVDCDIYCAVGTGTGAGIMVNGCQDVNIQSCRITGFNGVGGAAVSVIPSAANMTKVRVNGCILGPNSNLTVTNETGVKLVAGASALAQLSITDNSMLGCGTAINDTSTIIAGASKNINNNSGAASGLQAQLSSAAGITLGTTEQVILQIPLPPNALKVGTTFRFSMTGTATATTVTVRVRIGTAGTIADPALVGMGPTAALVAGGMIIDGQTQVTVVGASGAHAGAISVRAATAVSTLAPALAGNFATTSALFVSVCALAGAAGPIVRTGSLDIISPA